MASTEEEEEVKRSYTLEIMFESIKKVVVD